MAKEEQPIGKVESESTLPTGYRLDPEQGLVRDLVQVFEMD